MYKNLAQLYPNNEIRVTLCAEPCASRRDLLSPEDEEEPTEGPLPLLDNRAKLPEDPETPIRSYKERGVSPGYGGLPKDRGFSLYGRRQLQRCGGIADQEGTHQDRLFVTCTLPGSTKEAMEAIARWSSWMTNRMLEWLRYQCKTDEYMYVWEWQKRGALHWHSVVRCDDKSDDKRVDDGVRKQWESLLDQVAEFSGVDVWKTNRGFSHVRNKKVLQTKVVRCERSVARYLSKYLGKGTANGKPYGAGFFSPTRWYGICRLLLSKLRDTTKIGARVGMSFRAARARYEDCLYALQSQSEVCYEYRHKVGNGRTIVAYVSQEQREAIWTQVLREGLMEPTSSLTGREVWQLRIAEGFHLMSRNTIWSERLRRESSDYATALISKWQASQPMTYLEEIYLLEHLWFQLWWEVRVRLTPTPAEAQWLHATSVLTRGCHSVSP